MSTSTTNVVTPPVAKPTTLANPTNVVKPATGTNLVSATPINSTEHTVLKYVTIGVIIFVILVFIALITESACKKASSRNILCAVGNVLGSLAGALNEVASHFWTSLLAILAVGLLFVGFKNVDFGGGGDDGGGGDGPTPDPTPDPPTPTPDPPPLEGVLAAIACSVNKNCPKPNRPFLVDSRQPTWRIRDGPFKYMFYYHNQTRFIKNKK